MRENTGITVLWRQEKCSIRIGITCHPIFYSSKKTIHIRGRIIVDRLQQEISVNISIPKFFFFSNRKFSIFTYRNRKITAF